VRENRVLWSFLQRKNDVVCIHCGINPDRDAKGSTPEWCIQSEPNYVGSEHSLVLQIQSPSFGLHSLCVRYIKNTTTQRLGSIAGFRNVVL